MSCIISISHMITQSNELPTIYICGDLLWTLTILHFMLNSNKYCSLYIHYMFDMFLCHLCDGCCLSFVLRALRLVSHLSFTRDICTYIRSHSALFTGKICLETWNFFFLTIIRSYYHGLAFFFSMHYLKKWRVLGSAVVRQFKKTKSGRENEFCKEFLSIQQSARQ